MKFIVATILTALLSFAIGLFSFFPWWSFAACALVVAIVIPQKPWKAFISGFISLFLLWSILAFLIDNANEHILAQKVTAMLHLGSSYFVLILLTGFIGGLVAGLAALTGSFFRKSN